MRLRFTLEEYAKIEREAAESELTVKEFLEMAIRMGVKKLAEVAAQ